MNDLIIAGKRMSDFGVIVSGGGAYNSAERHTTSADVLGRSCEIIADLGHFKPVELEYSCGVVGADAMDAVRAYIASLGVENVQIRDSFHPDEYYIGYVNGGITAKPAVNRRLFTFTLAFKRRPERYLVGTEKTISASGTATLENGGLFPATFTAVITIPAGETDNTLVFTNGSKTFTVTIPATDTAQTWTLDTDNWTMQESTSSTISAVSEYLSGDEPMVYPGTTTVTISTGTSAEISYKLHTM